MQPRPVRSRNYYPERTRTCSSTLPLLPPPAPPHARQVVWCVDYRQPVDTHRIAANQSPCFSAFRRKCESSVSLCVFLSKWIIPTDLFKWGLRWGEVTQREKTTQAWASCWCVWRRLADYGLLHQPSSTITLVNSPPPPPPPLPPPPPPPPPPKKGHHQNEHGWKCSLTNSPLFLFFSFFFFFKFSSQTCGPKIQPFFNLFFSSLLFNYLCKSQN